MIDQLFLCTDLDRTLVPNGTAPESENARELFRRLVERTEITLAYVTGRHLGLAEDAIQEFQLPFPDYAITDVGTKIYTRHKENWEVHDEWEERISLDWAGQKADQLKSLFGDLKTLRLQEPEKQNDFKLSYYAPASVDSIELKAEVEARLLERGIEATLIWSIDETEDVGLLDILPKTADKLGAIDFLRKNLDFSIPETLFAGDSGNDLPVLISSIPSVLVANSSPQVQEEAREAVRSRGMEDTLYVARGGFLNLNGNYSAGILEGIIHYHRELRDWFH